MELVPLEVDDDIHVFRADGGIDSRTADGFFEQASRLVEGGAHKLIIDCSDLDVVSSAGLAALLRLHARLRTLGGDVRLAAVPGVIAQILRVTHLDRIFELHEDVSRAKLSFRPRHDA